MEILQLNNCENILFFHSEEISDEQTWSSDPTESAVEVDSQNF